MVMTSLKMIALLLLVMTFDLSIGQVTLKFPPRTDLDDVTCRYDGSPYKQVINEMSIYAVQWYGGEAELAVLQGDSDTPTARPGIEVEGKATTKKASLRIEVPESANVQKYLCQVVLLDENGVEETIKDYQEILQSNVVKVLMKILNNHLEESERLEGMEIMNNTEMKEMEMEKFNSLSRKVNMQVTRLKNRAPVMKCEEFRNQASRSPRMIIGGRDGQKLYCDTETDGGGWTVIQRRMGIEVDFNKIWTEYESGFGCFKTNFWIGLEMMSSLTSQGQWELQVELNYTDTMYYARYSSFKVGDKTTDYKLYVSGYSGTAGDSLSEGHNGMPFSTKDKDNVGNECAARHFGGWWFNRKGVDECFDSHLNGRWKDDGFYDIVWDGVTDRKAPVYTEMKIRPIRENGSN